MTVTLDTLDMTPAELESSKEPVRRMAYFMWIDAGAPDGGGLEYWLQAEREWIEHCYVPSRPFDGTRSRPAIPLEPASGGADRQDLSRKLRRRREKVNAQ